MTPEEARVLAVVGHELYLASHGTPLGDRMRRPEPGDLVLEITDFGRGWDPNRLGRLVRVEGRPPREVYVVAPLHRAEHQGGWRDGEFIALPTEQTRDWLLGLHRPAPTRYQSLTDFLRQDGRERIEMSFDDIEAVLGGARLPPSARNPRLAQWWDNDFAHEQAQAWMTADYHVEAIDIPGERVRFRTHH